MAELADKLLTLDNNKLIEVVKNYKQYRYKEETRNLALQILKERGIDDMHLKLTGNFENIKYKKAEGWYKSFQQNSRMAFILYGLSIFSWLIASIFTKMPTFLMVIMVVNQLLFIVFYFVFLVKSFLDESKLNKILGKKNVYGNAFIYFSFGIFLYALFYFYFKRKLKEEMELIN